MHMINRIGRSLRMGNRDAVHAVTVIRPQDLTFGLHGYSGENNGSQSIIEMAQEMIRGLLDEHDKIKRAIQGLQSCIEDGM